MKAGDAVLTLTEAGFSAESSDPHGTGFHVLVTLESGQVRAFAGWLLDEGFFIDFVTAVDASPALQVIYQFAHYDGPCRINARAPLPPSGAVDTISDIYQGADWHERETRDFFGVVFSGHHNLVPLILCDEDKDLKPLLKSEAKRKATDDIGWG
ncbi:NADH-quinone oxidoreductase subunit C [Desulfoluna spongiiphila]|uniref:NADH-quinone oxidoreductase subunit C n=1 Tax=Desulfoluna spongiiphila TaxID=419481 RepID=A0A1G5GEX0_9BACT|nr:NADH-quinone oxidoreductase subunit C [Desulfoluna spongiiphila]